MSIILAVIATLIFLLPGGLLSLWLPKPLRLMAIPALATCCYVLFFLASIAIKQPNTILAIYLIAIGGLAITSFYYQRYTNKQILIHYERADNYAGITMDAMSFIPIIAIIIIYEIWAGPFLDHGNDLLRHMEFIKQAQWHYFTNEAPAFPRAIGTQNLILHSLFAQYQRLLELDQVTLLNHLNIINPLLWSWSIYFFAIWLFRNLNFSIIQSIIFATLGLFFYWTTLGINSFNFVRAYMLAPVILNFGVFLSILALCIHGIKHHLNLQLIVLIALLTAVSGILHPQEGLFFLAWIIALSSACVLMWPFASHRFIDYQPTTLVRVSSLLLLCFGIILCFFTILTLTESKFDPIRTITLSRLHPALAEINILRPTHQFVTVLGLWGLVVLALSIVNIKAISRSIILLSGLLLPIITVFNPLFVEAFLRISNASVLWRFLFALPLPLMAAYLIAINYQKITTRNTNNIKPAQTITTKALAVVQIGLLIGLILPFQTPLVSNTFDKVTVMTPTPTSNSYQHWQDLFDFLETIPAHRVLGDPVTGYAINALTKHSHERFKFFRRGHYRYNYSDFSNDPLAAQRGWLLIVNQRDGNINTRLERPHHIYPDLMQVAKYYDQPLLDHLAQHPQRYKVLWQKNNITVYKIQ